MSHTFVLAQQEGVSRVSDGADIKWRALRDGSGIVVPWVQALVFEGRVFGTQVGSVSTGVNTHAGIDADQPEVAINIPDGTECLPLWVHVHAEGGTTTIGMTQVMAAVSDVIVGAGTATTGTAINMRLDSPIATAASVYHTYSGNGTDPLTAGHHIELGRASATNVDTDAAAATTLMPTVEASVLNRIMPVIVDGGSIVGYGESQAAAALFYASIMWAEFTEGVLT